jgi:HEAT repeat protein
VIAWLIFGLATGTTGAASVAYLRWRHREQVRLWREAAGLAGLEDLSDAWLVGVTGTGGGLVVNLDGYRRSKYESGTRITIRGDSGLTLRPEIADLQVEELSGHREIELGAEAFDDEVWVLGSAETARALLDAETRETLRGMLGGALSVGRGHDTLPVRVTVEGGDLVADLPEGNSADWAQVLAGALRTLLALARTLQRPADPVGRIVDNTRREPEWGVRLQNLLFLANTYPHHRATREALKAGCQDEREEVQLGAALALGGAEARPTLLEIATREWSEDSCSARAVAALGEHMPADRAREVLSRALRTGRARTAEACLESLGRSGGPEVVEPLAKVLAVSHGGLAVAAARALGASGAGAAEEPLLRALANAPSVVREAAAEALGHVGSARSVLPLKELAGAKDADGVLRRAARQAVAGIQSRLKGASPGQVSLTDTGAGSLSLAAEDPRGQLSYPPRKR